MTPEDKELVRGGILLQLKASYPSALREALILLNLRLISGMKQVGESDLLDQLRYLESKKMIARHERPLSAGAQEYTITQEGRAYLDEAGL
ncbi:MAG: hypothetical protein SFY80_10260 [Verrucomicrobiota bacterium]|nr:hypothetical protein [Verrucomicrobiota bacterium]